MGLAVNPPCVGPAVFFMDVDSNRLRRTRLPFRWLRLVAWTIGISALPALSPAQSGEPPQSGLPPEPSWPPSTYYYEARITPEGYALYVPFFIPRLTASGEGEPLRPPRIEREPRRSTERDPVGAVGRFEVRTREEVIPGEFIQVYRPAVYEIDAGGSLRLVEPEETVTLPKVRIVLERVWVSGLSFRDLFPEEEGLVREVPGPTSSGNDEAARIPKLPRMAK